jgi:hypothetical protein
MTDTMTLRNSTLANDLKLPPQARTILRHLETGKSITLMESLFVYSISGLAHKIHLIRKAGHDVICDERKDARGHGYGRYFLKKKLQIN